jgi:hypothetical protein
MCRLVEYVPLGPCVSISILGTILDLLQKNPPQVPKLFIPFLFAVCLNQLLDFFNKKLQSFRNLLDALLALVDWQGSKLLVIGTSSITLEHLESMKLLNAFDVRHNVPTLNPTDMKQVVVRWPEGRPSCSCTLVLFTLVMDLFADSFFCASEIHGSVSVIQPQEVCEPKAYRL